MADDSLSEQMALKAEEAAAFLLQSGARWVLVQISVHTGQPAGRDHEERSVSITRRQS